MEQMSKDSKTAITVKSKEPLNRKISVAEKAAQIMERIAVISTSVSFFVLSAKLATIG